MRNKSGADFGHFAIFIRQKQLLERLRPLAEISGILWLHKVLVS